MANAESVYMAKRAATLTAIASDTNAHAFVTADSSSRACAVFVPGVAASGTSLIDGVPFRIRASGKVTVGTGGTATFLPGIYYVASAAYTTVTAPTVLAAGVASTALAASTSYPWLTEATLIWDSTSDVLSGWYSQIVGIASGLTTQAIYISNFTSSVTLDSTTGGQGFQCAITMGTARASTTATLSQFVLEVL